VALNHANCGSERHDSWFGAVAFTRTTPGSLGSQYSPDGLISFTVGIQGESASVKPSQN